MDTKRYKRVVDNKLRGAFGETDLEKKVIRVNKARHSNQAALKEFPKKDRTMINTMVHEETHAKHPKMHERTVRKVAHKQVASMGTKQKAKIYSRYA